MEGSAGIQDMQHVFGIILPVSSKVKYTAGFEFLRDQQAKFRLHNTTFVVARFMPWIGEK
jgi:hypothetical protein